MGSDFGFLLCKKSMKIKNLFLKSKYLDMLKEAGLVEF